MGRIGKQVTEQAGTAARAARARVTRTVSDVETRLLIDEGRRSIRSKTATTKKVAKKALQAGLVTGVATVAAVIVHEVRVRKSR